MAKYIPSYIFENEGKVFKKLKKTGSFFKKRKLPKLNEFPENLRCSNINDAMHKLLVGECLTGAKSVRSQKCFGLYLLKQGRSHRLIHVMDLFKVV